VEFLGPALLALVAVILAAWIAGLRGRRRKRTPMSGGQADWTDGSD